ncbi:general secretion pathway protein GspD [Blastopirellula sp. JC732]|uniref:General secretion pathway protein GspD n=1 Tax=Blastopirellula sediminis TaxID=2894196 RepID=A0A9X1MLS7_9BACT|nr:general secretion pathway protein GspD [Blastopirellula sediminis]MCC9607526.1 general secretion pathway protein GspD [Blastopirellula sediminis]MCC9629181.1 general secretion pathway protein GspD [Blastopirellula sediminis]
MKSLTYCLVATALMWSAAQAQDFGNLADLQKQQDMLRDARQAMRRGDLDQAESLINSASQLQAPNDPLYDKFRDTPEKAKATLEQMRFAKMPGQNELTAAMRGNPQLEAETLIGQARTALANGQSLAAVELYHKAAKLNVQLPPGAYDVDRLREDLITAGIQPSMLMAQAAPMRTPPVAEPSSMDNPYADQYGPNSFQASSGDSAKRLMLDARRELARSNMAVAHRLVDQARNLGVVFPAGQDSPEKIEDLIRRTEAVYRNPPGPEAGKMFAAVMLEQAAGLIAYDQLGDAERLIRQAEQLGGDYSQARFTPDQLKGEIARRSQNVGAGPVGNLPPANVPAGASAHDQQQAVLAQAKAAMDGGNMAAAEMYFEQAKTIRVNPREYVAGDLRPEIMMMELDRARGGVRQASGEETAGFAGSQSIYQPEFDQSRNVPAGANMPMGGDMNAQWNAGGDSPGFRLLGDGELALKMGDKVRARQLFEAAWNHKDALDPQSRQRLQDYLRYSTQPLGSEIKQTSTAPSALDAVDAEQAVLQRQLFAEVTREQSAADRMRESDPKGALELLEKLRTRVAESAVDSKVKDQLLARVDRSTDGLKNFIEINRAQIELDEQNRMVDESIRASRQQHVEVEARLVKITDQFNELMDQLRWEEAEVLARQAREIAPNEPIVQNMLWKATTARRMHSNMLLQEAKEKGFWTAMDNVEHSAIPYDDNNPITFSDPKQWSELTESRKKYDARTMQMSEDEQRIRKALKSPVDLKFNKQPLQTVVDTLASVVGINIIIDEAGLRSEGVTPSHEITINMNTPVRLESALLHILQPLRLAYVIEGEALKITGESFRSRKMIQQTYQVADLVIPIPNFMPSYNLGLAGALKSAYETIGYGGIQSLPAPNGLSTFAGGGPSPNGQVLGQNLPPGLIPGVGMGGSGQVQSGVPQGGNFGFPAMGGPGGMGGGVQPDFDSLIQLITTTIEPESWEELGGPGAVQPFATNLSLVVSQTQEVHDKIADLLEQLRRLQDLQVTIEVRFITLNDNFFERIGIDFDLDIKDNTAGIGVNRGSDGSPSITIGLDQEGNPTSDLDLSFSQNSFGNTVPAIGGLGAAAGSIGGSFGFAMLSDIEAFFVMQAAQSDLRSNVMQAPKVTLFNGQTAFVTDSTQRPFVTSVTPVVGDFAAAQQPVIVVLNEGTSLTVQAVVSADRRFVRLTLIPMFSQIGDVEEFTFEGTSSSRTDSSVQDPDAADGGTTDDSEEETSTGTTVQQPEFSIITVTTTVSVPDGGTVLLGGIKRLSEERREAGVPVVSKLPYINRLFRNVGIGRSTQSLMMMVTPRIIIQEEEEEKLGLGDIGS